MSTKTKTVVILCAGTGSRMSPLTDGIHKSLLPYNFKSILSNIIESFPKNFEIIIPVGFKKEQIKYFCSIVHKDRKIKFIDIKNFKGKGSGPGYSLLKCEKYLNKPFYVTTCDTIFENLDFKKLNSSKNWVGISNKLPKRETINYCCFQIKNQKIINILNKKKNIANAFPFIGFCKIYDYKIFFRSLKKKKYINSEHQISNGIEGLLNNNKLEFKKINWKDFGNKINYLKNVQLNKKFDFSKTNEFLYLYKNKFVGKFFKDKKIIKRRFKRGELLHKVTPELIGYKDNFYFYKWEEGKTLYEKCDPKTFKNLLTFLKKYLWGKKEVKGFKNSCKNFYKIKTLKRLDDYFKKYDEVDKINLINNNKVINIYDLLKLINWDNIYKGWPCNFHGDLQFDNILNFKKKFKLIDWRDSFADKNYGDIYYDFAKLLGGIELNYRLIKSSKFFFRKIGNNINYKIFKYNYQDNYKKILINFIKKNKFDIKKVYIIKALIYLNMSPLHNYPFDQLLFYLGKNELNKAIYGNNK